MSRLVNITPEIQPEPEPEGMDYGYYHFPQLEPIKMKKENKNIKTKEMNEITAKKEPIQDEQIIQPLKEKDIINIQMKDPFCSKIIKQLENKKAVVGSPHYIEDNILKRYVTDNKQRFETIVLNKSCAPMLLKQAHDQMGHNGSARNPYVAKKNVLLERYETTNLYICKNNVKFVNNIILPQ